jgi:hypothetical protein
VGPPGTEKESRPMWGKKKKRRWGMMGWIGGGVLLLVGLAGVVAIMWSVRTTKEETPA